jgi:hypothetical protein
MNKNKIDDLRSLKAFQAMESHMSTKSVMSAEFQKIDEQCIKIARELAPLQTAGSPQAIPLNSRLITLRMERDGIKRNWNRMLEKLQRELEMANNGTINRGHERIREYCDDIWSRRRISYIARPSHFIRLDDKQQRVVCNFPTIKTAIDEQMSFIKKLTGMRLRPLSEINNLMDQATTAHRRAVELIENPSDEVELSEAELSDIQDFLREQSQPADIRLGR